MYQRFLGRQKGGKRSNKSGATEPIGRQRKRKIFYFCPKEILHCETFRHMLVTISIISSWFQRLYQGLGIKLESGLNFNQAKKDA